MVDINKLLGITESFEMPFVLLDTMLNPEKRVAFLNSISEDADLSQDNFRDYFQQEHSDRDNFKQDFTPDCICEILNRLHEGCLYNLDVCSGTGALTINRWKTNQDAFFQCEELTSRAIPILLCNLALRGINGIVKQKNVLTRQIEHVYKLTRNGRFSDIEEIEDTEDTQYDCIVSNPPYSIPWEPVIDERFFGYATVPKSKADYAFVLDILSRLSNDGKAFIVLPHGVLFRGSAEGKIREKLLEDNVIDAVIGLPDKLFLNTQIPVCILVLNKNKKDTDILFIDASKKFVKKSKQNDMSEEHISIVIDAYKKRCSFDKLSSVVTLDKIRENDYNLNIPRYVDTSEPKETIDLAKTCQNILELDNEIRKANIELASMLEEIRGTDPESDKHYQTQIRPIISMLRGIQ